MNQAQIESYTQTATRMGEIRGLLEKMSQTDPERANLCAENCGLIKIAVAEGWQKLVDYGCETDELYCGGMCPHCPT